MRSCTCYWLNNILDNIFHQKKEKEGNLEKLYVLIEDIVYLLSECEIQRITAF